MFDLGTAYPACVLVENPRIRVLLGKLQRMKGATAFVVTIADGIACHIKLKNLRFIGGKQRLLMCPTDTKVLRSAARAVSLLKFPATYDD